MQFLPVVNQDYFNFYTLADSKKITMFTVGIFTTHIPYIAFVVFYAYFILFGINKASSGELSATDSEIKTQITFSPNSNKSIQDTYNYHAYGDFIPNNFNDIVFTRQVFLPKIYLNKFRSAEIYIATFCRPPPSEVA